MNMNAPYKVVELAVHYMDTFLADSKEESPEFLRLIAIICFMIANKQEDFSSHQITIPLVAQKTGCDPLTVRELEMRILNSLGWKLNILTPSEVCIGLLQPFLKSTCDIDFPQKLCEYTWEFCISALHIKPLLQGSQVDIGIAVAIATFDVVEPQKVLSFLDWVSQSYSLNWV